MWGTPVTGRLGIDDVSPAVSGGSYPSKAVVGESIPIRATVWREGHDAVGATVVWRKLGGQGAGARTRMVPEGVDSDRWVTRVVPDGEGLWTFRVDAWADPWSTWLHNVHAKLDAGQDAEELANDLEAGARLIERVGRRPTERANR
jgi:starch synthase (maltosyl-transferring)